MADPAEVVHPSVQGTVSDVAQQLRDTTSDSSNALLHSFTEAMNQVVMLAPKLVAMGVVLVIGFVVANIVGRFVSTLCNKLGLQTAAERGGLVKSMTQVGIEKTVPQIVGRIVFWLLMLVFMMAAFDILELSAITVATQKVVEYIPRILVATFIVVIGLLAATFLRGIVATSANRIGMSHANQLADGCYYLLALVIFIAALEQVDIISELLNQAILIAFAAFAIGFGLAFGLGGRDVMGGILAGYYVRQRMHSGDQVTVAGFEGVVREVGPVATIIETEEKGLMHRHSIPNTRMLNEAVQ